MSFKQGQRTKKKARLCLVGGPGSGKTLSGLYILRGLVGPAGKLGVIDSEHGSALLYADDPDVGGFQHDELQTFSVENYIASMNEAARLRLDGVLIDSGSHAWAGKGGLLEFVDSKGTGAKFNVGWREAGPKQNLFVDTMLTYPGHIVMTLRSKMGYTMETVGDKTVVRKVGMQPVQREGVEYEFDFVGDMENGVLTASKGRVGKRGVRGGPTRLPFLRGSVVELPGVELGVQIAEFLAQGADYIAPEMPRSFHVSGVNVVTNGLTEATYAALVAASRSYEKTKGAGAAAKLLRLKCGKVLLKDLTELEGSTALGFMKGELSSDAPH